MIVDYSTDVFGDLIQTPHNWVIFP
jgi:hypothetical protein